MTLTLRTKQFAREALERKKRKEQRQRKKKGSLKKKTKKFLTTSKYRINPDNESYCTIPKE